MRTITVFLDSPRVNVHCIEEIEEGQSPADPIENDLFATTGELVDAGAQY